MRLALSVDNMRYEIDSTDPELLGRWVVEIFTRTGPFTPATYCTVQAYPSFTRDPETGQDRPDWVADSRVLGRMDVIRTPRDLLDALARQLADLEALT